MRKVLVTGGGGFVGSTIVRQLLARDVECLVLGRNDYPSLAAEGAICLRGDIRDRAGLDHHLQGVDTVFHVAALAGIWGRWQDYEAINVQGTDNVIEACRAQGVRQLIYTSTPSVVFDRHDICEGNESLPYPHTFLCHYARSKVMAERSVLAAADDQLLTCAIRPHLVWGPGDPHLIPRLMERGRARQLVRIGRGLNMVDISYVDNVAHAHLLAADNLAGIGTAAGKAYFISQGEPVNLWDWIGILFQRLDIPPVNRSIPFPLAYMAGSALEWYYRKRKILDEPRMTRFLAMQLAHSHWFSTKRAQADLGYRPLISNEEGMDLLIRSIRLRD
ncbi:MAG: NAD-dependent epimerase/dehydratase family protein [Desulfobulbaceae bacterium]|uniref:NAD-dependent epimerase/dehydratase family protein n=1 Tax=Candidatus Desulfatifera sulfidica TaxID=2841691 RepID=A0A8J6N9M9_9BACT|nr:NAD-dependent epimerase/dehydratase family protein [Candidatus Desulfatifera sulfidica]